MQREVVAGEGLPAQIGPTRRRLRQADSCPSRDSRASQLSLDNKVGNLGGGQ